MNCPHCGAHVPHDADVCPQCNKEITRDVPDDAPAAWCNSCGSPIPANVKACPVCGMPMAGAFDDGWEDADKGDDAKGGEPEPELASALPPAPEPGEDAGVGEAPIRRRLVILATVAALIVVGGTTLYITRPWDPDAYITHATEEADTSEEGSVHSVSHLTGQDLIEDAERAEYLKDAETKVKDSITLMGEVADFCTTCEGKVDKLLLDGELPQETGLEQLGTYRESLSSMYEDVSALDLRGSSYEGVAKNLLVVAQYLQGRVDTLYGVCEILEGATDVATATVAVEAKLASGSEGRSLEDWRRLYENAYASLEGDLENI